MESNTLPDVLLFCQPCSKDFGLREFIKHNSAKHTGEAVTLNCNSCKETFNSYKRCWIKHLYEAHSCGEKPLPCPNDKCFKTFDSLSKLSRHIRDTHKNKKRLRDESQDEGKFQIEDEQTLKRRTDTKPSCVVAHNDRLSDLLKVLKPIRNNPSALAELLSREQLGLQSSLEPFLAGLRSGRLEPLESVRVRAGIPQLFQVSDAEPDLDLEAVWGAAIVNLPSSTIYQGSRKNTPLPFESWYVRSFVYGTASKAPKYAMNISLPEFSLHPPQDIAAQYHIYEPEGMNVFEVSANINTHGSMVDLHDGTGRLSTCVYRSLTYGR
jgi:hypothetical protein